MTVLERIKFIAEESKKLAIESADAADFKENYDKSISDFVTDLIECDKPRLTVCGIYSAGKSTIVNVLCRQEVAEVGAQPKTDKITEYSLDNKDYILVDSPGVDAPIEHEKITDDFIKKSNVLMFVISTKNAESEANYRKINEWMEYEKPLIIVLNDKSGGLDLDSKEINVIRVKIEENLRNSGYNRNKKYDVIAINAKMAYNALSPIDEKKRKIFLEKSNVLKLETLIDSKMKDGYSRYVSLISGLHEILDRMDKELSAVQTGNNKELIEQLDLLDKEQIKMNESIVRHIKMACDNGKEQIINVCMSGCTQEKMNDTLNTVNKNISISVDDDFKRQIKNLSYVVNENLDKYGIEMTETGKINIQGSELDFGTMVYDSTNNMGFGDAVANAVSGAVLGEIIGVAAGEAVAAGSGAIATALAGAPLGPIGIIGGVVLGLLFGSKVSRDKQAAKELEIQQKIAEENRRRQAERDAYYKKLQVEIGSNMDKAKREYSRKATEAITLAVSNLKDIISKKIADVEAFNDKLSDARKKIAALKAELEGLKNSMN